MPKVRLTPEMREFAEAEIAAGLYLDMSDVVRAALRKLMEERGAAFRRPEGEHAAAADEVERCGGPAVFDAKSCGVIGQWRIVGADIWDSDDLDLVGPGWSSAAMAMERSPSALSKPP